jgi:hypothetical protein
MARHTREKKKGKFAELGKRSFVVRESIFKFPIYVLLNYTSEEFEKFAHRMGATDYKVRDAAANFTAFSTYMTAKDGRVDFVICLKKFDWAIAHQGTLIHEIVHTIVRMWGLNNVTVTDSNQEFFAHSIGLLYEDIAAKILRLKRK